jgi:hypothetical protein
MPKEFSELEKEQFNAFLPVKLVTRLRERAARRRWSLARTTSEAICKGMDLDPAEYGIEAEKQTA